MKAFCQFLIVTLWVAGTAYADKLEIVATFDESLPPGNLAIAPNGRMFMSVHEFYGQELRLVEILKDGTTKAYPTEDWARATKKNGVGLKGVFGIRADRQGILWILDGQDNEHSGRVIGWDTNTESLHKVFYLSTPVTQETSFLNDLAVDHSNNAIYITDTGNGENSALIVVDMKTGLSRRVLEGSRFTVPEDIDMVIENRVVELGGQPARIGVNPITIDPTNTWLYFAPMSGKSMYRIKTQYLLDNQLTDSELEAKVERYGDKPISDGSTIDAQGNVYVTAITDNAIGVIRPTGEYDVLYQSETTLPWPDGFSVGVDGYIYATVNELFRSPVLNRGKNETKGEFKIVRFKSESTLINGR